MLSGGIMTRGIGRSLLSGPSIVIHLPGGGSGNSKSNLLFRISGSSLSGLSRSRGLRIFSLSLTSVLEASIQIHSRSSLTRAARTCASLARSGGQRTSWDEAAASYFSEEGVRESPTSTSTPTPTSTSSSKSAGVRKWKSPADREWQEPRSNSDPYEGGEIGRGSRSRKSESAGTDRRRVERRSSYGADTERRQDDRRANGEGRNRTDNWQRPAATGYMYKDAGAYMSRNGNDWQTKGKKPDSSWGKDNYRGQDERAGFGDDRRWPAREYSPPLQVEGQALYGVAPIISALQISRRTFYTLYMQENLLLNIGNGRRKDKAAVTAIEKMAKGVGVTVKEASKHDLNMLVDNRPHQGLILDASPLELIPVDTLDPPIYQENKSLVWVALDEVTDPQNFGAILRSAYFLGAEGVVVCAKNSAPLSGVVSKASAGAMEVMEVLFCKNMVRFLDRCKENGWRVVGASAEPASVSVRQLPSGIATILVLGNEGKGLRTNVKRSCDQLVSIAGISTGNQRPKYDFVAQDEDEDDDLDLDEDEESVRRGAESFMISGPSAVDSLNVSVAAGIMLYELLDSPTEKDAPVEN